MALLEIKNLSFSYHGASAPTLKNIDLTVESGEFVLVCGESGCGKTTLLKLLKNQLRPAGEISGEILYQGEKIESLDERASVSEIGYVMQNPEHQTVTDLVRHELAFGLESLGESPDVIRRKVAEICGFFGIGPWYHRKICELSGGQKQLLALASVMVMDPQVLVLDEPTAQLDPIAAAEFLLSLRKINQEMGVTVIVAEHRLEEVFPMASRVALMEAGGVCLCDTPRGVGERLAGDLRGHRLSIGMPAAVRLFAALRGEGRSPLTVKEGKDFLQRTYQQNIRRLETVDSKKASTDAVLEITGGFFRYSRELPDVLSDLHLRVLRNETLCILGANGAGKTTLLRVLSGVRRLYRGKYRLYDEAGARVGQAACRIACLPQDPRNLFVKNTLREDLLEVVSLMRYSEEEGKQLLAEVGEKLSILHLYGSHPYDLSGGEQQKAALAKLLLMKPDIILLDEPTKGLDAYSKKRFAELMAELKRDGKTVVMVTHDVEFAAEYADRCAMFFDGGIVSISDRVSFFATNRYYTTAAARMTASMYENAITVEMAAELCRRNGKRSKNETDE